MLTTCLLACLALIAVTTPALCDQFFLVQHPATNRFTIAEQPPTVGAGVIVGDGAYGDRATAEAEMKTIATCAGKQRR